MDDRISTSLQENLITLLGYSDAHGGIIANSVDVNLFEGDYRTIAARCVEYWQQQSEAPKVHLADLFDDILDAPGNARRAATFKRILSNMAMLSKGINADYAMRRIALWTDTQQIKMAIVESAEKIAANQEMAADEVKEIWHNLLKTRDTSNFEPGTYLTDVDDALARGLVADLEFPTGIPDFDLREAVPGRGELGVFLAAAKQGKTWWLIHLGKMALLSGKKVLHVSLEMKARKVQLRYYQSLFSVAKRYAETEVTRLRQEESELVGFDKELVKPVFALNSDDLRIELDAHLSYRASLYDNLLIKSFPSRTLTINALRAYLDTLEATTGFIPDLMLFDYLGIIKTDPKNHRIDLGMATVDLRGIAGERNIAIEAAHQISRKGADVSTARLTHISEDFSIVQTADQVKIMSRTEAERKHGLARIYVAACRGDEDGYGVLITQNYTHGQFALESAYLSPSYFSSLSDLQARYGETKEDENAADDTSE
jgi:hypothetical protein